MLHSLHNITEFATECTLHCKIKLYFTIFELLQIVRGIFMLQMGVSFGRSSNTRSPWSRTL